MRQRELRKLPNHGQYYSNDDWWRMGKFYRATKRLVVTRYDYNFGYNFVYNFVYNYGKN